MRRPKLPKRPKLRKPGRASLSKLSANRPPLPVIVVGVLAVIGIVLLLRACGGDDEKEVRQTVERFGQASRDKDYQALCDDLFSTAIVENLRSSGQPCEVALRTALEDVQNPTVEVRNVEVDGRKATAEVASRAAGQRPSEDRVELLKEDDGWRISSLANEAPPDPAP